MNLFKNMYEFFFRKREKNTQEEIRDVRYRRLALLPNYKKIIKQEL